MRLRRSPKERKILGQLKGTPSSSILFHHRYPTSTENVKNACHPFSTQEFFDTNYVLVHNGMISNSHELKREHEKLGITYYSQQKNGSFNDSEALLWDVALYLEGKQDKLKAYGGIAFICLAMPKDKRTPSKLHFARNNSPLMMDYKEGQMIVLASEGEGEEIKPDTLYSYNYKTTKLETKELEVPRWNKNFRSQNFHYTPSTSDRTSHSDPLLDAMYGDADYGDEWWASGEYDSYADYVLSLEARSVDADKERLAPRSSIDSMSNIVELRKFDDDYDMIVLDEKDDYSYQSVMGNIETETVFENNEGRLINVKQTVADRVDTYLELAEGRYLTAFEMLKKDIKSYRDQLIKDANESLIEDEDLIIELDLLTAAKITLYTSSWWVNTESIDPVYSEFTTEATKAYLNSETKHRAKSQTQLLAEHSEAVAEALDANQAIPLPIS